MPTVLRIRGYRFFFYSLEGNKRSHIHIEQAERVAKFWLEPVSLAMSRGFRSGELTEINRIIEENQNLFLGKWNEYFNR